MQIRFPTSIFAASAFGFFALHGCGGDSGGAPSNTGAFLETYADIVHAAYADSHTRVKELGAATAALVTAPDEDKLTSARNAWLLARDPYLQTEAFRFSEGPIDEVDDFVNAWPLNEVHLDYVVGMPNAGLVNDLAFIISGPSLEAENLSPEGGESDVAVGFHAIEFLLWGQDANDDGPGDRRATDYVTGGGGTASNQARRGQVLATTVELLEGHLGDLESTWALGGDYRTELTTTVSSSEALRRIVFGLVSFSGVELGGERLTALDSHDQEDEHSCFSDNTHRDFVMDAIGIENVFLGRYVRTDGTVVSGTGLYDVIAKADADLARALRDRIAATVALALAIHAPFDQEIVIGNTAGIARVTAFQSSLVQQRLLFVEAASALDLPDPPAE